MGAKVYSTLVQSLLVFLFALFLSLHEGHKMVVIDWIILSFAIVFGIIAMGLGIRGIADPLKGGEELKELKAISNDLSKIKNKLKIEDNGNNGEEKSNDET